MTDDELHPGKAAVAQAGEERAAEHLVLAVTHINTEDLPPALSGDPGGDHDGFAGDQPATTNVQVGRIQEHVGVAGGIQPASAEPTDLLIEPLTDPGDFGLEIPVPPRATARSSTLRVETTFTQASMITAYSAWSIRRRASSTLGKNEPARSFGIANSTVPALVISSRDREPLRSVTRSGVCS